MKCQIGHGNSQDFDDFALALEQIKGNLAGVAIDKVLEPIETATQIILNWMVPNSASLPLRETVEMIMKKNNDVVYIAECLQKRRKACQQQGIMPSDIDDFVQESIHILFECIKVAQAAKAWPFTPTA